MRSPSDVWDSSEYRALYRTIVAQPENDTPRLVCADWLEEQGDPRAELIRTQCELARVWNENLPALPEEVATVRTTSDRTTRTLSIPVEEPVFRQADLRAGDCFNIVTTTGWTRWFNVQLLNTPRSWQYQEFLYRELLGAISPDQEQLLEHYARCEKQLLAHDTWVDFMPPEAHLRPDRLFQPFVQRGFVDCIEVTPDIWLDYGPDLITHLPLRFVRVKSNCIMLRGIRATPAWRILTWYLPAPLRRIHPLSYARRRDAEQALSRKFLSWAHFHARQRQRMEATA